MSEYQYYEFRALDRPLSAVEMGRLRDISTRAAITPTSFVNEYHWSALKADPWDLVEKYFDAFLYTANWGIHWLLLRFPNDVLDFEAVSDYLNDGSLNMKRGDSHTILSFSSEIEGGGDWEEGDIWLASLISIRSDIIRGDYRGLYIAWLSAEWEFGDEENTPPIPPGMTELTAPQASLAEFLRVDDDMLEIVSGLSTPLDEQAADSRRELRDWVDTLDKCVKDELLCRAAGGDLAVQWELQGLFRQHRDRNQKRPEGDAAVGPPIGEIRMLRDKRIEQRERDAELARQRADRQRADERKQYLEELGRRSESVRAQIDGLIATVKQDSYDRAVKLLVDLHQAAELKGESEAFGWYIADLRRRHSRKPSLMARLDAAELSAT